MSGLLRGLSSLALGLALTASGAFATSGCAVQRSFAELGYPPFGEAFPPGTMVTLAKGVSPESGVIKGWIGDAEPPAELVYRAGGRISAGLEGEDVICRVTVVPLGDDKISSLVVLAYPLAEADLPRYRTTGRLPDAGTVLTGGRSDKPEPDGASFEVAFRIPKKKLASVKRVALPWLVRFRHDSILATFPDTGVPE